MRFKPRNMNHVILLTLTDPLLAPIERVLSTPHERANRKLIQPEFLPEFSSKSSFDGFSGLQSSARSDPKRITAPWWSNPHQKHFLIRCEKNGSNRLAINNHGVLIEVL
jgi:hypothetical protein